MAVTCDCAVVVAIVCFVAAATLATGGQEHDDDSFVLTVDVVIVADVDAPFGVASKFFLAAERRCLLLQ